jgi:3-phosphoshikimate 1-carboxyvinyltransferase
MDWQGTRMGRKKFRIATSKLSGQLAVPPSKSHTLRALLFALMADGKSIIRSPLLSPDTEAMVKAIELLGGKIAVHPDRIEVEGVAGRLQPAEDVIQVGNSGIVFRFIAALAALLPTYTILTGDRSIRHNRPIQTLLDGLCQLGAVATSSRLDGHAPIIVKGAIAPGEARIEGEDSQPVSALLIALSFLPGVSKLHVDNPGEKPFVEMTLDWLRKFGAVIHHSNYENYLIQGGLTISPFDMTIPGDLSTALYPIAAALITNSELTVCNIDLEDVQGDKKMIQLLIEMGAKIEIDKEKKTARVLPGSKLRGIRIDINDCIDAITILPVIGSHAEGVTEIVNGAIARKKESDRIRAIATELGKMGAKIEEREDGLIIHRAALRGATLDAHADHRMALSLSVAALAAEGESTVEGVEAIEKTYATFADDFRICGAKIEE